MPELWRDLKLSVREAFGVLSFVVSHPLNRDRPLAALSRLMAWQVASRLRTEIDFEWIEGTKLIVRRGMTGATGNIYCGLHEFAEMGFALHLLRPNDLFLDIGANIGSYTVLSAGVCKARAIAFEPDPDTARVLRRNIAINRLTALAEVRELALGEVSGQITFTAGLGPMNRVARTDDKATQEVPMGRLDDVPGAAAPTLIKLDVEGFEEQVLSGATRILESPSLLAVQSELCSPTVRKILGSFCFERRFYDPFTRTLRAESFGYHEPNTLFVRRPEMVAERLLQAPFHTVGRKVL